MICKVLLRICKVDAVVFLGFLCYNISIESGRNHYEIVREIDRTQERKRLVAGGFCGEA